MPVISETDTIRHLLARGQPEAPALLSTDGLSLTHRALAETVERLAGQLRSAGVGRGDRVAVVLPNGPEMALAFLAVTACATVAPLNPTYREDEFRFYLDDLGAKALLTLPGDAVEAQRAAGEGVLRLEVEGRGAATRFARRGGALAASDAEPAAPQDVALVLHTSGTTTRPKIVPLTQRNLAVSARNIVGSLALGPEDRCLNVMPLFHIHGLVAALLSSLAAGGSAVCSSGFDAFRFFTWLGEAHPSWYTAVPTMHQLVLARSERQPGLARGAGLRFLRSSSAAMPPVVMAGLEAAFGAPLIEAYGMTEASHQMATNPLPPGARKPGSVGRGAGVEVAVMDQAGSILDQGQRGEVVIRGANVTQGYENNPEANASAFANGWFRTGDEGVLDSDRYLSLTGRLKELINRGGEKISPREVDDVLLQHPAVAQAVAFAVPHERLGEEIAAAVVLCEGASAGERELRDHAARHLAGFKVPRRIVIVTEIPKGATGKVQRIGLAEKLGLGG